MAAVDADRAVVASHTGNEPLPAVRSAVRELLLRAPAFRALDSKARRTISQAMVQVCHAAARLLIEEAQS